MIKISVFLSSTLLLLTACAINPDDLTAKNFADEVMVQVNYDSVEVTGASIKSPIVGEKNGLLKAVSYIVAKVANDPDEESISRLHMELRYFDNQFNYEYAVIDSKQVPLKATMLTLRECSESCQFVQSFRFPVDTQFLFASKETGFEYKITSNTGGNALTFQIPAAYIQGLLMAASKKTNTAVVITEKETTPAVIGNTNSKAVQMNKYWFNEATVTEKEIFTNWAFKNRKKITTPLNGETKTLEMLEYWYEKASTSEKAEILSWVISQ